MSPQVVLIIGGLILLVVAILGSGDFVKVVIPNLPAWARICLATLGIAVFALAFIPGIVVKSSSGSGASSSSPPTQSSAPITSGPTSNIASGPTSNPTPSGPVVTLTAPTTGTSVSRSQGFIATGKALSLGSYTVWILDYDGGYTVDQEGVVANGLWSAVDKPLGGSSDQLPYYLAMRVVIADQECATKLQATNSTTNDYLTQLPAGCKVITGVTVDVTKP
jgi:hypothetical protein